MTRYIPLHQSALRRAINSMSDASLSKHPPVLNIHTSPNETRPLRDHSTASESREILGLKQST